MAYLYWTDVKNELKNEYTDCLKKYNLSGPNSQCARILKCSIGNIFFTEVPLYLLIKKRVIKEKNKEKVDVKVDLIYFDRDKRFFLFDNKGEYYHGDFTLKNFRELMSKLKLDGQYFFKSLEKKAWDETERDGINGLIRLLNGINNGPDRI